MVWPAAAVNMALPILSESLAENRLEASCLSAEARRLSNIQRMRGRYRATCHQRMEDRAFSLYCSHDWNDPCLRLCLEQIVSPPPSLDVETLLWQLQGRCLRTPLEDIADIPEGRGGWHPRR